MTTDLKNTKSTEAELRKLLKSVKYIATEAFCFWDNDQDMKVGKILKALSGELPGYRVDIDKIIDEIKRCEES
ncbi:MAG: hypothetical protein M0R50_09150 [Candidatus Cloacimonetes bacterium]|jgi:hypothetical protein|nr:hypothetical protein [Candidatus Cloacimonadota bacterium]